MASEKLKPCPFCGGKAFAWREMGQFWEVRCECGSCGPTRMRESEAIAAWNNRPAGTAGEEA